jgi:hypothetical protein
MIFVFIFLGVAFLELLVGEFKIDIEDFTVLADDIFSLSCCVFSVKGHS